jgi:hypothetical protein
MAAVYPLTIDQGETFRLSMIYATPADAPVTTPVPINLTGAVARMQIREKYGSPVLVEITTENHGITIIGLAGQIDLVLTATQTDLLGVKEGSARPRTNAVYDLEVTVLSGDVKRVVEGQITINPNITRAQ